MDSLRARRERQHGDDGALLQLRAGRLERGRSSKFEDSATSRGLRRIAEALGLSASTASHYVARADRVRDEAMAVAAEIRGR